MVEGLEVLIFYFLHVGPDGRSVNLWWPRSVVRYLSIGEDFFLFVPHARVYIQLDIHILVSKTLQDGIDCLISHERSAIGVVIQGDMCVVVALKAEIR